MLSAKPIGMLVFLASVIVGAEMLIAQTPPPPPQAKEKGNIEALKKTAPKVYIDCDICDIEYIKTEITFVNYVRDRKEAQLHILITTQRTGGGGREYTMTFMGQNEFAGIDDIQKSFSDKTNTDEEIRKGLVHALKIGLMSYVARTPIAGRIAISYEEAAKPAAAVDKWKNWVFSLSGSGDFMGEKSYSYEYIYGSFSANRVTPGIKIGLTSSATWTENRYVYDSDTIDSSSSSLSFEGLVVKSIGDHWSAGGYLSLESSTYENVRTGFSIAPAIEYDLFPYSQSTRRQLRFLYKLGFNARRYREETVYFKMRENLFKESLSVSLELKEKWGSWSTTLSGSHYFHDFKKNRLTLYNYVTLNLLKGLNVFLIGSGSRIHDQLSLVKSGATLEEILLQRTQLETTYSYFFSIGLSYTFGSIYTNVVNPRFGTTSSGGVSISLGD
jgi:hypothetical protein